MSHKWGKNKSIIKKTHLYCFKKDIREVDFHLNKPIKCLRYLSMLLLSMTMNKA